MHLAISAGGNHPAKLQLRVCHGRGLERNPRVGARRGVANGNANGSQVANGNANGSANGSHVATSDVNATAAAAMGFAEAPRTH